MRRPAPCVPKSSLVSTRPWPKNSCHIRLTATRAVSGFSGPTSQRASVKRLGVLPLAMTNGFSTAGTAGSTLSPLLKKLPRM